MPIKYFWRKKAQNIVYNSFVDEIASMNIWINKHLCILTKVRLQIMIWLSQFRDGKAVSSLKMDILKT